MKKKFLLLALALVGVASLSVSAQSCDQASTPQAQNKMRQPREFTEFAFEGILLDMNQQQRIDSLNVAMKANCPALPEKECAKSCDNAAPFQGNCEGCQKGECKKGECKKGDCKEGKGQCKKNKEGKKTMSCDKAQGCEKAPRECDKAPGAPMMGRCPYGNDYVAKVKEILTPEQYTLFLENIVSMPQGPQKGAKARPKQNKMMKARDCQAPDCPNKSEKK